MYELIASLFSMRTLSAAVLEPEEPEGGSLTITPDDQSDEGSNDESSSDDD